MAGNQCFLKKHRALLNFCAYKIRNLIAAALSEESLQGEWDRIKIKCNQPYKKDAQFGLAFIRLRSLEEPKEQNQAVSPGPTMSKVDVSNFTSLGHGMNNDVTC